MAPSQSASLSIGQLALARRLLFWVDYIQGGGRHERRGGEFGYAYNSCSGLFRHRGDASVRSSMRHGLPRSGAAIGPGYSRRGRGWRGVAWSSFLQEEVSGREVFHEGSRLGVFARDRAPVAMRGIRLVVAT